jgi:hypothetical protein
MKRIEYRRGEEIGSNGVIYIEEAEPYRSPERRNKPSQISRRAVVQCPVCSGQWIAHLQHVKKGDSKSCGCLMKAISTTTAKQLNAQRREYGGKDTGKNSIYLHDNGKYMAIVYSPRLGTKYLGLYPDIPSAEQARDDYRRSLNPLVVDAVD